MRNFKLVMSKIGKEVVYLFNPEQEIVVRIEPEQEFWFAKEKGGKEYRLHHSTDIARETLMQAIQITPEDYLTF
jgi:hypothetical protein